MISEAVTVSINFADYLARCIQRNARLIDRWLVVTSVQDVATQRICAAYPNIEIVFTSVSYEIGVTFPKSRMINEGFRHLRRDKWVLHLDSDIRLPADTREILAVNAVDPDCIYGPEFRWLLNDDEERVGRHGEEFKKVIGYFQFFHGSRLVSYPETSDDAGRDDMLFNENWLDHQRVKVRGFAPEHFGPKTTYWRGRELGALAPGAA
jgi:hypothetical protein